MVDWFRDPLNLKRSNEPGGHLTGISLEGKVMGGQSNHLPQAIVQGVRRMPIDQLAVVLCGTGQGSSSMPPTMSEMHMDRENSSLLLLGQK